MPFGRRKAAHKARATRARDPFDHLADERRAAESEAWFLQPDDGPDLEVQAGISSNLRGDDLEDRDDRDDLGDLDLDERETDDA